jgi:hypothetical protein
VVSIEVIIGELIGCAGVLVGRRVGCFELRDEASHVRYLIF